MWCGSFRLRSLTGASGRATLRLPPSPTPPMAHSRSRSAALLGAILVVITGVITGVTGCATERRALVVEPIPSPTGAGAAEPFVGSVPDGSMTLSWLERAADSSVALKLSTLSADGATWSTPTEIVRRTDLFVNWADFPSVVPLGEGRLLAHWLQRSGDGRYAYDVHLSESRDGGATWGESALPHAAGVPAEHGFVTILPTGNGGANIVLLDGTAGARMNDSIRASTGKAPEKGQGGAMQLGFAAWADGAVTTTRILDPRTCDCCQTASALTSKGPIVVYRDRSADEIRDMSVVRLENGEWTSPTPLHNDGWKIDYCPVNGPATSAIGDTVVVVWFTGAQDTSRVNVVFSTDAGASFSEPVRADGGLPTGRVDVELLSGDAALVSWLERVGGDTAQVRARIVRRDGTLEPHVVVSPSSGARSSGFPRMARTADGVLVAWTIPGKPSRVEVARIRTGKR